MSVVLRCDRTKYPNQSHSTVIMRPKLKQTNVKRCLWRAAGVGWDGREDVGTLTGEDEPGVSIEAGTLYV